MRSLIVLFILLLSYSNQLFSQEKGSENSLEKVKKQAEDKKPAHLLNGTTMHYFYTNGGGIEMKFYEGMLSYKWIKGPRTGNGNKDLPYNSRKIGDQFYIVSWLEESHPDYTTLVFNFKNKVMYSSGIFRFGSPNQFTRFDAGIIEHLTLVEQ